MEVDNLQLLLHQELGVPESVITNLQKKSKKDKDVNQLLEVLKTIFVGGSFTKAKKEIEDLKHTISKKEIDHEQEIQDFETKLKSLEAENKAVSDKNKEIEKELTSKDSESGNLNEELLKLKDKCEEYRINNSKIEEEYLKSKEEKDILISSLSSKVKELEGYKGVTNNRESQLFETRKELSNAQRINTELRSNLSTLEGAKQVTEQKLNLVQAQVGYLQKELDNKIIEFSGYRIETSAELSKIQLTNERLQTDLRIAESKNEAYSLQVDKISSELRLSEEKVIEMKKSIGTQEDKFRIELAAKTKLAALYQENSDEANERIKFLEKEHENLMRELSEQCKLKDDLEEKFTIKETGFKDRIEYLENQLESYKFGHDAPEIFNNLPVSESAQHVLSAHKSGKSFTEIYADYIQLEKELNKEKSNNYKLHEMVDILVKEIETSAPYYEQQRLKYDEIAQEACDVSKELENARIVNSNLKIELETAKNKIKDLSENNNLIEKEADTLAFKIKILSSENAMLKKNKKSKKVSGEMEGVTQIEKDQTVETDAKTLYSRTNKEDQSDLIKDFASKLEEGEKDLKEQITILEAAFNEKSLGLIQELKAQLEQKNTSLKAAQSEIEILRKTAQHAPIAPIQNAQSPPPYEQASNNDNNNDVARLKNELEVLRKESNKNHSSLQEQNQLLKGEITKKDQEVVHLQANIRFFEDRCTMLDSNNKVYLNETNELRKRNKDLEEKINKKDQMFTKLLEESNHVKNQKDKDQVTLSSIRTELELTKKDNERLSQEISVLHKDKSHLNDRIIRLQFQLDESYKNESSILSQKGELVDSLKRECDQVKEMFENSQKELHSHNIRFEREFKNRQEQIDSLNKEIASIREKLILSENDLAHSKGRVDELTKDKERLESLIKASSIPGSMNEELLKLRQEKLEIQIELNQSLQHQSKFQGIAKASEEALQDMSATYEGYKKSTEALLKQHNENYNSQTAKIKELEECIKELNAEHSKCIDKERKLISESDKLKEQLTSLNSTQKSEIDHLKSLQEKKDFEINNLNNKLLIANQKYESELTNHAEKIASSTKIKEENEKLNSEIFDLKSQLEITKTKNETISLDRIKQEEILQLQIRDLNNKCNDLTSINDNLLKQLEKAEARFKGSLTYTSSNNEISADLEDSEPLNHEVIKYLRREKQFAETKNEALEAENNRIKVEKENCIRELEHVRSLLDNERNKEQNSSQTSEFAHQLEVKTLHLKQLNESNAHLRLDNDKLLNIKNDLEAKYEKCQNQLISSNSELQKIKGLLGSKDAQIKRLEEDRDHWADRAQQILTSDRVDPIEHQKLKDDLESKNKALSEANLSLGNLESISRELDQAKTSLTELEQIIKERDEVRVHLDEQKDQFNKLAVKYTKDTTDLKAKANKYFKILQNQRNKNPQSTEINSVPQETASKAPQEGTTESENTLQVQSTESREHEVKSLKAQVMALTNDVNAQKNHINKLNQSKLEEINNLKEELEKVKDELNVKVNEINLLKGELEASRSSVKTLDSKNKEVDELKTNLESIKKEKADLESNYERDNGLFQSVMDLFQHPNQNKQNFFERMKRLTDNSRKKKQQSDGSTELNSNNRSEVKPKESINQVQPITNQLSNKDAEIKELKSSIELLNKEIDSKSKQIEDLSSKVKLLENDIDLKTKENSDLIIELNKAKENNNKINELETKLFSYEVTIKEQNNKISGLENKNQAQKSFHQSQINKLKEEISKLKSENEKLQLELDNIKQSIHKSDPDPMAQEEEVEVEPNVNVNEAIVEPLGNSEIDEQTHSNPSHEIATDNNEFGDVGLTTEVEGNQGENTIPAIEVTQNENAPTNNKRKSPSPDDNKLEEGSFVTKKTREDEEEKLKEEGQNETLVVEEENKEDNELQTQPIGEDSFNVDADLEDLELSPLPENELTRLISDEPNEE